MIIFWFSFMNIIWMWFYECVDKFVSFHLLNKWENYDLFLCFTACKRRVCNSYISLRGICHLETANRRELQVVWPVYITDGAGSVLPYCTRFWTHLSVFSSALSSGIWSTNVWSSTENKHRFVIWNHGRQVGRTGKMQYKKMWLYRDRRCRTHNTVLVLLRYRSKAIGEIIYLKNTLACQVNITSNRVQDTVQYINMRPGDVGFYYYTITYIGLSIIFWNVLL